MQNDDCRIISANEENLRIAGRLIREGELVAFPTETVYGLGADACSDIAIAKIFEAKNRPQFNPLIVHYPSINEIEKDVEFNDFAKMLARHFWGGAMTLVLNRSENCRISKLASAGLPTLAVRIPSNKTAMEFLKESGVPIAAPSANKSGSVSPTSPVHVANSLGDRVKKIIAGGRCEIGLESTVIYVADESNPVILRSGAITAEDIEKATGRKISYSHEYIKDNKSGETPISPGQLLSHYAPNAKLRLNAVDLEQGEALIAFGLDRFMGIKGGGSAKDLPEHMRYNLSENADLTEAASNLFNILHEIDKNGCEKVAIMNIPQIGIGIAINDRLSRAAGFKH